MNPAKITSLLNPKMLAESDAIRNRFQAAQPFPHVVIDEFFAPHAAAQLLEQFPAFELGNYIGDDGVAGGKSTIDKIRNLGPSYAQLDDVIQTADFLQAIGKLTGIDDLLYDPWYLGGGTHENRDGMTLSTHVDFNLHPSERWHRRLNLIVYLNQDWQPEWGGNLELFRDPHVDKHPAQSVAPTFNRCVIFETSERSWHGFDRIALPPEHHGMSRKSIALYFYTKDRPVNEIADRHTTYYVNRPLPERYIEGHLLTANDAEELHALIAERDGHIRMLYAENTALRKAQDAGITGHLLYLARRAYVRFRR